MFALAKFRTHPAQDGKAMKAHVNQKAVTSR
jgi:hypothetical protein